MLAQFLVILNIVLPVFIVILLGYLTKRLRLVDGSFLFHLNRLVYYIALPALLFYKIASADFETSFNLQMVLGYALAVLVMFILTYIYAAVRGFPREVRGVFSQCAFRGNLAYIGLALIFNGYGEAGLASGGVMLGFVVPVINFFSIIALLIPYREKRVGAIYFVKQLAANPMIIAPLLGIIWSFLRIPMPVILDRSFSIVTGMALPLALIAIGASFSMKRLQGDIFLAGQAAVSKLLLTPAVTALIMYGCGARGMVLAIGIICAATPTATASYVMTQQIKGDAELAGTSIMLTTLLSCFSYVVILMIVKSLGM